MADKGSYCLLTLQTSISSAEAGAYKSYPRPRQSVATFHMAPRSQRPVLFPISPSAIPAFSSSFRVHDSLSFAYSTTTNARNSEAEYYAAYQHTLSDLTNFPCDSSLSVQPQSDLWLSSAALEKAVLAAVAAGDGPDGYSSAEEEQAQAANKGSAPLGTSQLSLYFT